MNKSDLEALASLQREGFRFIIQLEFFNYLTGEEDKDNFLVKKTKSGKWEGLFSNVKISGVIREHIKSFEVLLYWAPTGKENTWRAQKVLRGRMRASSKFLFREGAKNLIGLHALARATG